MSSSYVSNGSVVETVNAFGIRVQVSIVQSPNTSDALAESLLARLTLPWRDSPVPDCSDGVQLNVELGEVTEANFEQVHSSMSTQVTLAALKAHAGKFLMLHAGGIARSDGAVAVIIGPSGRGKTTTMCQLGQYFGYVSDETVAISASGSVLPYRKPLSVMSDGHDYKLQIAPSDLGLLPLPDKRLFLGSLVLLERAKNNESESTVSSMSFARGVASVVEQSSYLFELEKPLTLFCTVAASVGGIKVLTVGDPSRIHEVADQLFVNEPAPHWTRVMPIAQERISDEVAYLPASVADAVECEDGTVVFTESRHAIVLDGIGPQLWRAACLSESWDDLISRVEHHHGPAPSGDSRAAIKSVAENLIECRVLRLPTSEGGLATNG